MSAAQWNGTFGTACAERHNPRTVAALAYPLPVQLLNSSDAVSALLVQHAWDTLVYPACLRSLDVCHKNPQGCALDFFTTRSLTENDEARVSMEEYMSRRNGACRHQSGKREKNSLAASSSPSSGTISVRSITATSSALSRAASPPCAARREDNAAVATADNVGSPAPSWTEKHVSVVRDAIFGTLAGFARDALKAEPSAVETRAAGADEDLLLFNEQFVVKPPQSSIEFGWHTVCDGGGGLVVCFHGMPVISLYPGQEKRQPLAGRAKPETLELYQASVRSQRSTDRCYVLHLASAFIPPLLTI